MRKLWCQPWTFRFGFLVWLERSLSCLLGTPYWWCWPVVCISFIIHRVLLISCLAPGHALHVPPETESVLSSNSFCISGSLHPTAAKSHPVVELWKVGNLPIIPVSFFYKSLFLTYTFFYLDYLTSGFRREPRIQFKQANALWTCWFSGPVNLWISS